jgi:protein-tyrosine phosphatase
MVDIHCHILPGLDDGAKNAEISLQMAEMAIAEGVTHVIGTPHANSNYAFVPEAIRERCDELQSRLKGRLTLATGCDFHLSYENMKDIRENPHRYTLNQKKYLLVEFADYSIPPTIDQNLHQLHLAGLRTIVTHPERNPLIRANPGKLLQWMQQGCYVQVTAQSFLGRFGPGAQETAEMLLARDCVHFVASDAHNLTSRPLKLREAYARVAELKDESVAEALFTANPRAAFDGEPLPYTPDLPEKFDDRRSHAASHRRQDSASHRVAANDPSKRRKRFWFF